MNDEFGFYLMLVLFAILIGVTIYTYATRNRKHKSLLLTPIKGLDYYTINNRTIFISIGTSLFFLTILYFKHHIVVPLIFWMIYCVTWFVYWAKIDNKKINEKYL